MTDPEFFGEVLLAYIENNPNLGDFLWDVPLLCQVTGLDKAQLEQATDWLFENEYIEPAPSYWVQ